MKLANRAIDIACGSLEAAGAQYRIITAEGLVRTNIAEPEVALRKVRNRTAPHGTYHKVYHPVLSSMQPGAFQKIAVPDELDPELLRGAASAWASHSWGSKKHSTEVSGRTIGVQRFTE